VIIYRKEEGKEQWWELNLQRRKRGVVGFYQKRKKGQKIKFR
jgi:hypothetical protein